MTPLRRRLFLLSTASLIPLAVLAAFGIRVLQTQHQEEVRRIGQELSRSIANAVDADLQAVVVVLKTLSTATTLEQGDLPGFARRLELILRQQRGWYGVVLATPDNTILLDTRRNEVPAATSVTAAIRRDLIDAGLPDIGVLTRDRQNRWYVPVRMPVLQNGDIRYVLTALVSADVIRDTVTRQRVPADWIISIVDRNNRRVARSRAHEENVGGELSPSARAVLDSGGTEGFGISESLEGERIYTPFSRLQNGWAAVLGLPTAQADAAMQRAILVYGGGILLSIVLGLLGAASVGRTITRPIDELRSAAVAVGQRGTPHLPSSSIKELREAGSALEAAAEELRRSDLERETALARERAARQAAEAADRSKDEFLGILSHELRTPLNAVFGWGRMLQSGQLRDEAAAVRARDAIVRNAGIQMQMIDDLLDLSRIASGKMRIDLQEVAIAPVVEAALEAVRPAAAAKQITIATDMDTVVPALAGDASRLQQVFWNLLMNAVKFTPAGGRIDVAVKGGPSDLRVVVRDTGEGITPDVLPHVFERFRQADSSITRPHGGLGLGLALAKHLTEIHGGRVEAASPGRGQGATFTVTLPLPATPAATDAIGGAAAGVGVTPASTSLTRLDALRVVVIDDDAEGLRLTETVLAQAGAEVTSGTSAAEGLALVRGLRPDVLVSDVGMPDEDGYSLIARIRALGLEEGGSTPAIALTAYGRPQDYARAIAAGFNLHVTKPVDPVALTALVDLLARRAVDEGASSAGER